MPAIAGVRVKPACLVVGQAPAHRAGGRLLGQSATRGTPLVRQLLEGPAKLLTGPEQESAGCVLRQAEDVRQVR